MNEWTKVFIVLLSVIILRLIAEGMSRWGSQSPEMFMLTILLVFVLMDKLDGR